MIRVEHGDCLAVMDAMAADGVQVDAVVTDPPYHLTSIVKRFGKPGSAPAQYGTDGAFARASRGFMGKEWDGGGIAFNPETWRLVFDLMKPGAHLFAFGGTRTYHRMVCAIEDAGFEIRDQFAWVYGSGFPKSHDVSKAIDKAAGVEREVVGSGNRHNSFRSGSGSIIGFQIGVPPLTAPATDAAKQWQGWGTAVKPAWEPIVLARKPLSEPTIAANVLAHGTGALNIDGCRVPTNDKLGGGMVSMGRPKVSEGWDRPWMHNEEVTARKKVEAAEKVAKAEVQGRFPANLVHDGSEEVLDAFPGSAARFFYAAKASKADRAGSRHPTVKPVSLIRWLVRMITPPGGVVLDPFAGSGTTGAAALAEGMRAVLIEREAEYVEDIRRRLDGAPKQLVLAT